MCEWNCPVGKFCSHIHLHLLPDYPRASLSKVHLSPHHPPPFSSPSSPINERRKYFSEHQSTMINPGFCSRLDGVFSGVVPIGRATRASIKCENVERPGLYVLLDFCYFRLSHGASFLLHGAWWNRQAEKSSHPERSPSQK